MAPSGALRADLFREARIEAVVPARSSEEIQIELEAKLQQLLLPEAG
jgi:hypothetical protein